jgi:hypothetical protein
MYMGGLPQGVTHLSVNLFFPPFMVSRKLRTLPKHHGYMGLNLPPGTALLLTLLGARLGFELSF